MKETRKNADAPLLPAASGTNVAASQSLLGISRDALIAKPSVIPFKLIMCVSVPHSGEEQKVSGPSTPQESSDLEFLYIYIYILFY